METGLYYITDTPRELFEKDIYVGRKKILCGENYTAHRHNFIEIEMIISGFATVGINGKKEVMAENCIYMLRPTDIHTFSCENTECVEILKINMSEKVIKSDILDVLMSGEKPFSAKLSAQNALQIQMLSQVLFGAVNNVEYNERTVCDIIDAVFSTLLSKNGNDLFSSPKSADNDPVKNAIIYMQLHFAENPPLEKVAHAAHYNPSYFSRLFHGRTNKTYVEYLNSLKINCAKKLLLESTDNVTRIGEKCGFNSHSNFLRTFFNEVGCSPTSYRKSIK